MKASSFFILILFGAIVISNGFWFYTTIDQGVSLNYQKDSLNTYRSALRQMQDVLPLVLSERYSKDQILDAAKNSLNNSSQFEKEGFTWIGQLGFRFNSEERLLEIKPAWEPI